VAKAKAVKRLASFGKQDRNVVTDKIKDWLDHELIIIAVTTKTGEHGAFAVFDAIDENGHDHVFSSGAKFVMDALDDVEKQSAFPVGVKFYMEGNTVLFT